MAGQESHNPKPPKAQCYTLDFKQETLDPELSEEFAKLPTKDFLDEKS